MRGLGRGPAPTDGGELQQPALPRLGRPSGITGLRTSDRELSYEVAMGRKVRVDGATYRGQGRAGDATGTFAPPRRPEDAPVFFKSLKDTPTFIRFCNTLPARPAVSPHERRVAEHHRQAEAELAKEQALVAALQLDDPEEDQGGEEGGK